MHGVKCEDLTAVNSPKICEYASDKPCGHDPNGFRCLVIVEAPTECLRGLNALACNLMPFCIFHEYCTKRTIKDLLCRDAGSYDRCLQSVQPCIWQENKCMEYNEEVPCSLLPKGVSPHTCFQKAS